MRTSQQKPNPSLKRQIEKTLAQILSDIKDIDKMYLFLQDFFTDAEYETFAKRLAVAYWLKKGRGYKNIKENLKVSSATIASAQSLIEKPGIKLALKIIEAEEWAGEWTKKIKKFVGK
jgi:uncharacterized protein YerC